MVDELNKLAAQLCTQHAAGRLPSTPQAVVTLAHAAATVLERTTYAVLFG